jgi:hypothetical protein
MGPNAARQVTVGAGPLRTDGVKGCAVNRACPRGAQLIYQATVAAAKRKRKPHH